MMEDIKDNTQLKIVFEMSGGPTPAQHLKRQIYFQRLHCQTIYR
jgi:hypothetical protein